MTPAAENRNKQYSEMDEENYQEVEDDIQKKLENGNFLKGGDSKLF